MVSLWKLLENNKLFLYIVFPCHVTFCCRNTKAQHHCLLGLFSILVTVMVAIPKHVAQSWPFLMGAAVCCWLRATSDAGSKTSAGPAPSSSFSCAEGGSGGQSCRYCPAESRQGTTHDPGTSPRHGAVWAHGILESLGTACCGTCAI